MKLIDSLENSPLVSVIIPVYNNKNWLNEAVTSVLNQTYNNYEIIIVNDGSTDDILTLSVLSHPKIVIYNNDNHGVAYSRNFGIKKSKGKYIAFLDSDDLWDEKKLEIQVNYMIKYNSKWSQHNYYYFKNKKSDRFKLINTYEYRSNSQRHIFLSFKIQTSCVMVDSDYIKSRNIEFDETKTYGEDSFFYIKLMKNTEMLCINQALSYFRIRGSNTGQDIKKQLLSRMDIWNDWKEDVFFNYNTSRVVKITYKYCFVIGKFMTKRKIKNKVLYNLSYIIPWLIFKVEGTCLRKKE